MRKLDGRRLAAHDSVLGALNEPRGAARHAGAEYVGKWAALKGVPGIDDARHAAVLHRLRVGAADAANFSASAVRFLKQGAHG